MMSPRTKFVLIFLLFSIPFVASTIVFIFWKPTATSNYGQLIAPVVALPETNFVRVDGVSNSRDNVEKALRGKWLLVTRDSGACEATCRKKLYAMRQARLILGREQDRVVRLVLVDDDVVPAPELVREYAGTIWVSAKSGEWLSRLPVGSAGAANVREPIYGVDTLGNAFIRYPSEPDIKKLSADFLRVLKASQIG
jgi:cytochrome oxidase Cu insertion factor (SCO1/SenC/PrrC family)